MVGNQLLATYHIGNGKYHVFGCWDEETPEYEFDFYDVHDEKGNCINEGDPFYEGLPTRDEVKALLKAKEWEDGQCRDGRNW